MSTARVTMVLRPFSDEAEMRVDVDVPQELLAGHKPVQIADACFEATNIPQECAPRQDLVGWLARAVLPRRELSQVGDMRSLSVGDRVEFGDVSLVCANVGWTNA